MTHFSGTVTDAGATLRTHVGGITCEGLSVFFRGYLEDADHLRDDAVAPPGASDVVRFSIACARGYRKQGLALPDHLHGQFALAIHDPDEQRVLLAHDCLGIVPLYYREGRGGISFATHLWRLVARDDDHEVDEDFVTDFLVHGDHYGDRTGLRGVHRLPIATSATYGRRGLTTQNRWNINLGKQASAGDTRDHAAELEHVVTSAVRAAIPEVGTTWCELSGGLDSSTVLAAATAVGAHGNIACASFVYPKSNRSDESSWIDRVVDHLGVVSHRIDADRAAPFSALPDHFFGQPELAMVNLALHAEYRAMLARHDVAVVLTGMGGDGVLHGDGPEPFFLADLACKGRLRTFARTVERWMEASPENRPLRYWIDRYVVHGTSRWLRRHPIQDTPPPGGWLRADHPAIAAKSASLRATWVPVRADVGTTWYLERVLRSANVVSLWWHAGSPTEAELRHPLMSRRVIEHMCAVPHERGFSPRSDRALHRTAFAGRLPGATIARSSKGSPDQSMYRGLAESQAWLSLLLDRPRIVECGYVDREMWQRTVELATVGRCDSIMRFKAAATLEVWLRQLEAPLT